MDAIIFTKDQFTDLMSKLDTIQSQISIKADPKKETFLDNQEFLLLMKISKRTGTILKTKFISLFLYIFVQLIESTSSLKMICLSGIASTCLGLFFFAVSFPNIDKIFS